MKKLFIETNSLSPYGPATSPDAPLIALGEGWAYHMGHFLADQRYVLTSSDASNGQFTYPNEVPIAGLSSHINALEDFSPQRTSDPFRWIPKGLMWDLMDNRNETRLTGGQVDDAVAGFTIQQLSNPLQSDVTSLQQYRDRLQQQNPNNQTIQVTNLFAQYGY